MRVVHILADGTTEPNETTERRLLKIMHLDMADLFDAEPILVVTETPTAVDMWPIPQPIEAVNIRNNHLEYAITWYALAAVLLVIYMLFRRRRR